MSQRANIILVFAVYGNWSGVKRGGPGLKFVNIVRSSEAAATKVR